MLIELGAVVLALTLSGLWSYGLARAGVYAAIRHATARHDPSADVCLRCLRQNLDKYKPHMDDRR